MTRPTLLTILLLFCWRYCAAGVGVPPPDSDAVPILEWRFHAGDSAEWANPGFDDSDWQKVSPPALQPFPWRHPRGWFRAHIEPPERLKENDSLGVWLGPIRSADEVYVNGQLIGGEGVIGEAFVDAPHAIRVYRIPAIVLTSVNVLAVRVQNSYPSGGLSGRTWLGDYQRLSNRRREREHAQILLETFSLGVLAAMLPLWVMLRLHGMRRLEMQYSGWLVLLLTLVFAYETLLFYRLGLHTAVPSRLYIALCVVLPAPVLRLVAHLDPRPFARRVARWTCIGVIALALGYLAFGTLSLCTATYVLWWTALLLTLGLFIHTWLDGNVRRIPEVRALGIGLVPMALFGLADFWLGVVGSRWNYVPLHFLSVAIVVAILFGLTARFASLQRMYGALSQRVLATREEQAKRISRDLHDGLGQALLATKLNLQYVREKFESPDEEATQILDALIEETGSTTETLRRTVRELRPASLAELGFAAALYGLGDISSNGQGPVFRFDIDPTVECSPEIENNLYRIAQEATANAVKHAEATTIQIRLERTGAGIRLEVADDGCGFDWSNVREDRDGLGLVTMRERLVPFNGRVGIRTHPGRGTYVIAEVSDT